MQNTVAIPDAVIVAQYMRVNIFIKHLHVVRGFVMLIRFFNRSLVIGGFASLASNNAIIGNISKPPIAGAVHTLVTAH